MGKSMRPRAMSTTTVAPWLMLRKVKSRIYSSLLPPLRPCKIKYTGDDFWKPLVGNAISRATYSSSSSCSSLIGRNTRCHSGEGKWLIRNGSPVRESPDGIQGVARFVIEYVRKLSGQWLTRDWIKELDGSKKSPSGIATCSWGFPNFKVPLFEALVSHTRWMAKVTNIHIVNAATLSW